MPRTLQHPAFVPLSGSLREPLTDSRPAGPADTSEIVTLTVRVRGKSDPASLDRLVAELYARPLAERKYLSHAELAEQHGADPADLDAVEAHAQANDLQVAHRSAAERSVRLVGSLADALRAFPADVAMYHHASGSYRGRRGEISVPQHLAGIVTGVFGFDTRPKHKAPHFRRRHLSHGGPGGANGVPASEFAKRYNFPTSYQGKTLDGSGETIAIIELGGGFSNADLRQYFKEINQPAPGVVAVSVDHVRNRPTRTGAADGEVMLDIEVAGTVAPGARIAVYFGPNRGNGFLDTITAAVHDTERKPSVISISWGSPEEPGYQQQSQAFHDVFAQAAALGITVCTAAGDHGVADEDGGAWDKKVHVDHPSVDDLVLACGGTQIEHGVDVVWNDGTPFGNVAGGGGWAGGGGISQTVAVPDYQKGLTMPPALAGGKPGRGVPDIAMSATNYFTRVQGQDSPSGGTSAVAPLMAALVVLLNQAKQHRVGFMNPFLYANAAKGATKDVTAGTNGIPNTVTGYTAVTGWDPCTGLGTPDGTAILQQL